MLTVVNRARNRRIHPRPDAGAVVEREISTQGLPSIQNIAAVIPLYTVSLPNPSLPSSSTPPGRKTSPEFRRRRERRPLSVLREKTVRLNHESLTSGSRWPGFYSFFPEPFFCFIFLFKKGRF